jgi:hypothetical protein
VVLCCCRGGARLSSRRRWLGAAAVGGGSGGATLTHGDRSRRVPCGVAWVYAFGSLGARYIYRADNQVDLGSDRSGSTTRYVFPC